MFPNFNLVTILGPTATGKTRLAAELCTKINGEIISADSRQIYKKMNLGTGKDYDDYMVGNKKVKYHLIDIKEAGYKYNVFEFQKDFFTSLEIIKANNNFPVLCGGSGLYIDAAINGYKLIEVPPDKELRESLANKTHDELITILESCKTTHNKSDFDTIKRTIRAIEIEDYNKNQLTTTSKYPEIKSLNIGIFCERDLRRKRISDRLKKRIEEGLIEEVESLLKDGISPEQLIYYGLEYKFVTEYIIGKYDFNSFYTKLEIAIHQFAKRQMTYFRSMEKKGTKIYWLDSNLPNPKKIEEIIQLLYRN